MTGSNVERPFVSSVMRLPLTRAKPRMRRELLVVHVAFSSRYVAPCSSRAASGMMMRAASCRAILASTRCRLSACVSSRVRPKPSGTLYPSVVAAFRM
eukprot:5256830-Prymnesium_polylepis.1